MFEQDWVMRQVDMLIRLVARMILKQDGASYEIQDETKLTDPDLLYLELKRLVADRRICEAEDLLYDRLDPRNSGYLSAALDFYDRLNRFSDGELEAAGFSRGEVDDGVHEIVRRFGVSELPV